MEKIKITHPISKLQAASFKQCTQIVQLFEKNNINIDILPNGTSSKTISRITKNFERNQASRLIKCLTENLPFEFDFSANITQQVKNADTQLLLFWIEQLKSDRIKNEIKDKIFHLLNTQYKSLADDYIKTTGK